MIYNINGFVLTGKRCSLVDIVGATALTLKCNCSNHCEYVVYFKILTERTASYYDLLSELYSKNNNFEISKIIKCSEQTISHSHL